MIEIEFLLPWIGKEQQVDDEMNPDRAVAMAAVLDHTLIPDPGDALPPCWHWLYFLETPSTRGTGADGHPVRGGFLPPVPLPRRMWAAGKLNIVKPLVLGATAHKASKIRSIDLKVGKAGPLVFVTVDHVIRQHGEICISEEQTIVYREMPTMYVPLAAGEPAPTDAHWARTIMPDPVLLFRYSSLTYNSHRIHYDRRYAIEEEFYPGLVVHGPLLATLIIDLLADNAVGKRIKRFEFRAVRPTFDLSSFSISGKCVNNHEALLWSADHEGFLCMSATAEIA